MKKKASSKRGAAKRGKKATRDLQALDGRSRKVVGGKRHWGRDGKRI